MKVKHLISVCTPFLMLLFFSACQGPVENVEEETEAIVEHSVWPVSSTSEEAVKEYNSGLIAWDLGDNQRARTHFDKAIEMDPEFAAAYVFRSFTSRSTIEFTQDVQMANEKNIDLNEAEQLLIDMDNAFLANDVDLRMKASKSFVEKYPKAARSHVTMGQTYQSIDDHENARASFMKAIELAPDWIVGYSSLGESQIFDDPKDLNKAEENFMKVVELMPNESRSHIGLGDVYRAQKNLEQALASYRKASELAPNDPVAFSKAGHANTFLGNFEDARADFEKSGSMSDFPAAELNFTAFTHLYDGEHEKGMTWLKDQAIKLDESDIAKDRRTSSQLNVLNNCMWMSYHLEDVAELKALLEIVEPLDYEDASSGGSEVGMKRHLSDMNFWKGMIASLEGNTAMANELAEACKNDLEGINNPDILEDHYFLNGEIAMKTGDHENAISHFENSNMDDLYVKFKLAMANRAAGNVETAMELLMEIEDFNFNNINYALVRKEVKEILNTDS